MKVPKFDPVIHAPIRLQICALLSQVQHLEFQLVRDELEVSDSVLSKHLSQLTEAGYVLQSKFALNGRQRTLLGLTREGRRAFDGHVATLQALASLPNGETEPPAEA